MTPGPSSKRTPVSADLIGENEIISVHELCERCMLEMDHVLSLVREGIIEPCHPAGKRADPPARPVHDEPGEMGVPDDWAFTTISLRRVRVAYRLQRDLGVNLAGAALALDLLDQIAELRMRLQ